MKMSCQVVVVVIHLAFQQQQLEHFTRIFTTFVFFVEIVTFLVNDVAILVVFVLWMIFTVKMNIFTVNVVKLTRKVGMYCNTTTLYQTKQNIGKEKQ